MKYIYVLLPFLLLSCGVQNTNNANVLTDEQIRSDIYSNYNNFSTFKQVEKSYWDFLTVRNEIRTNIKKRETHNYSKDIIISSEIIGSLYKYTNQYYINCLGIALGLFQYSGASDSEMLIYFLGNLFYNDPEKYIMSVATNNNLSKYATNYSLDYCRNKLTCIQLLPAQMYFSNNSNIYNYVIEIKHKLIEIDKSHLDSNIHETIQRILESNKEDIKRAEQAAGAVK